MLPLLDPQLSHFLHKDPPHDLRYNKTKISKASHVEKMRYSSLSHQCVNTILTHYELFPLVHKYKMAFGFFLPSVNDVFYKVLKVRNTSVHNAQIIPPTFCLYTFNVHANLKHLHSLITVARSITNFNLPNS